MKKSILLNILVSLMVIAILFSFPISVGAVGENDVSITNGCHTIDAQMPLFGEMEEIENVKSAFLYDYTNETLLYSVNPDEQQYPASLVKIMTGLIIAERADMTDIITVREDIIASLPPGSIGVNLQAGEQISMQDLMYCTMVESANDAAAVAADHVCGSQDAFVAEMNRYAEELGCTATNFTNVHGIHDANQYSTARDLARILSKAAKNEVFMDAFSKVNYTVPATNLSEPRELSSNNHLMNDDMMTIYLDSRVTGGRSGTIETGERNLAATAESNGVYLVSIVLGSASILSESGKSVVTFGSFEETTALLDLGFKGHSPVQLFFENQTVKQFEVINGDSYVCAGTSKPVQILLPHGVAYEELSYRYADDSKQLQAPIKEGDLISNVNVWYNNVCLAQADLYAMHDVNEKQVRASEEYHDDSTSGIPAILIIVIVIVALLVLLLFGRRIIFRIIRRSRVRRHRKNRRRSR